MMKRQSFNSIKQGIRADKLRDIIPKETSDNAGAKSPKISSK